MEKRLILEWVNGSGDGDGWGEGSGLGSGWGSDDGSGWGDGWGSDDGSGWGDGDGDGWGDGSGEGSGEGSVWGSGWGDGWVSGWDKGLTFLKAKGNDIYYIDDVPTAITSIFGNFTKGFVLQRDFSTKNALLRKIPFQDFLPTAERCETQRTLSVKRLSTKCPYLKKSNSLLQGLKKAKHTKVKSSLNGITF